jgi:hypothetical protein
LGWLLAEVDRRFGGIVPSKLELDRRGNHRLQAAVRRWGGAKQIEPFLYPRAVSLLPYYLAILIHAAGNPEPIAELGRDCLQDVPLLENRQALVWFKARAGRLQRRTFERNAPFEPPALVRDILAWNERLRPLAPPAQRDRLFIFKGLRTVNAMSTITVHHLLAILRTPRPAGVCVGEHPAERSVQLLPRQRRSGANAGSGQSRQRRDDRSLCRDAGRAKAQPHAHRRAAGGLPRAPHRGAEHADSAGGRSGGAERASAGRAGVDVRLRLQGSAGRHRAGYTPWRALHQLHGLLHLPQRRDHAGTADHGSSAPGA